MSSPGSSADVGLLSPVTAGTAGEQHTGDETVLTAMLRAEAALLRALARTGIAPQRAETAAEAVASAKLDTRELALRASSGGNPVIPLVRALREKVDDDVAEWVHHGATSQDIVDTALALLSREVAAGIETNLLRLAATLAELADGQRAVPAVARTLTQQAMPTTVGMRAAHWLAGVHEAIRAVRADGVLPASLGGPIGTNAAYGAAGPAVVDAFAADLDLPAPIAPWHTRRAPVVRLATALTLTGEACGKIAADVLVLSQTEIGEVREATGGGSSAMPHKANPAQSVLVSSAARQLPALGAIVGGSASPEQERPAGAWHAEWQPLREMLRLAAASAERSADLAAGWCFDHDAIERNIAQLLASLGQDRDWPASMTEPTGVWIDRILTRHREEFT